jgi:beta-lactamase class A
MHRRITFALLASLVSCSPLCCFAQAPPSELSLVNEVLSAKSVPSDIFASTFLAQIPASQVTQIRDQVTAQLGAFVNATGSNGQYVATFTHGRITVLIHLDASGKIDGLRFTNPVVVGLSLQDALAPFQALPGSISYVIVKNDKEMRAFNQNLALGVGSTFKLAVLNALLREIQSGKRRWSDVVYLKRYWKSLPSGVYQTWPDGIALTLQTLAAEMISVSDNTAADALARIVGRAAIAPFAGRNAPFLTTREMFILKSAEGAALRQRYLSGSPAVRRAVVARVDRLPLPKITDLDTDPALSTIEWHYTNRELCKLMAAVQSLPLMSINPGVASPSQWRHIAYKGGSDWGVISMTTWLVSPAGTQYCVSVSWNDASAPIDETKFAALYQTLLSSAIGRASRAGLGP